MGIAKIPQPMDEHSFQMYLFTRYFHYCVLCVLLCLLVIYYIYCKVLRCVLEKTKIPKLYKITTLHSLWMGSIHLVIVGLCFSQLNRLVYPLNPPPTQPGFLNEILYAATAKFCQPSSEHGESALQNSGPSENSEDPTGETPEWNLFNAVSVILITSTLWQEVLLATRFKMKYILYSRASGLLFLYTAVRTWCPILSIQGSFLMSINASSKEIARALVAWKAFSQEDSDLRPPPFIKTITFLFFLIHICIWFSLMLFFMPFFVHNLPSLSINDPDRLFVAYMYLSFIFYILWELGTSPLLTTLQCMAWCRRSSGIGWRILALSDCHLLGHYSPLVLELYHIQVILDERKALFRNRMVQKHLAAMEGKKRRAAPTSQSRRPTSLLAAVKTVVALKKKIQRRIDSKPPHSTDSREYLPQVIIEANDSNVVADLQNDNVETVALFQSEDYTEESPSEEDLLLDEIPGASEDQPESLTEEKSVTMGPFLQPRRVKDRASREEVQLAAKVGRAQ